MEPVPRPATAWPLVARDEELAVVNEVFRRPGGPGVLLYGAAGVGKTRLAREVSAIAEEAGWLSVEAIGTEAKRDVAFGAFGSLLRPAAPADAHRPFGDLTRSLDDLARGRRVVVVIDDAHLLDESSTAFVHHLALHDRAKVLATVRTGAGLLDPLVSLWKDGHCWRMDLQPLSRRDTTRLLEDVLAGQIDAADAATLWVRTKGNPFYLGELVGEALRRGDLRRAGGLWRLTGDPAPSGRLLNVVSGRLLALAEPIRDLVQILAFSGSLPLAEAQARAHLDVVGAERLGLVVVGDSADGPTIRLAHPMYGDVIRERLSANAGTAARRSRASAKIVGGLDAVVERATSLALDGKPAEAERVLAGSEGQAAGSDAATSYLAFRMRNLAMALDRRPDAERLLGRAGSWASGRGWSAVVAALRAELFAVTGQLAQAVRAADEILDDPALPARHRRHAVWAKAAALLGLGRAGEARAVAEPLISGISQDAGLEMVEALARLAMGQDAEVEAAGRAVHDDASTSGDDLRRGMAAAAVGSSLLQRGKPVSAARWFVDATSALDGIDTRGMVAGPRAALVEALAMSGQAAAARAAWDTAPQVGAAGPYMGARTCAAEAWLNCATGRADEAGRLIRAGLRRFESPADVVHLAHTGMRIGLPAAELADPVGGAMGACTSPTLVACAGLVEAAASADAERLAEASIAFESLGMLLAAAEAAALAARSQPARSAGWRRAKARSSALASRCEGARTALLGPGTPATVLTRREAEVARLAAGGHSNEAIAESLEISRRTAENHLQRAYRKLGISSRHELQPVLPPEEPGAATE